MTNTKMTIAADEAAQRRKRTIEKYKKIQEIVSVTLNEKLIHSGLRYHVWFCQYCFGMRFQLPRNGIVKTIVYYKDFAKMDIDGLISSVKALERLYEIH